MSSGEITIRTVAIGSLAADLVAAESQQLRTQRDLEMMLDSLFADWQDVEHHNFVLDVYGVIDSPSARDALHRAGFVTVHLHDHISRVVTRCGCRRSAT